MTPELQQIIGLLEEAEQYFQHRENPKRFIAKKIKPAFIAAHAALKALEENKLKDALRTAEKKFARADLHFKEYTEESISDGFREYGVALRALHEAKKLANSVES